MSIDTSWRQSAVFRGLDEAEAESLSKLLQPRTLAPREFLVREGDAATEMFFLSRGTVEVVRVESGTQREHVISQLGAGQVVGEMALVSGKPRAASIRAQDIVEVLALPLDALRPKAGSHEPGALRDAYSKIVTNLAGTLSDRLRDSNDEALKAAQARVAMGQFTINIFLLLAVYVLTLGVLPYLQRVLPGNSTYITVPLLLVFGGLVVHFMKVSGYPLATFGLTTRGLGKAALEGALYTVPVLVLLTGIKWAFLRSQPRFDGRPVLEYDTILGQMGVTQFIVMLTVYSVFTFVQELVVRGGLQSALSLFLATPGRHLTAILVSNVLFSVTHMHLSAPFAFMAFIPGVYWGWIYKRQHHLAGVTISHMIFGVFVFFVLGPDIPS